MNFRRQLARLGLIVAFATGAAAAPRPNFVFILIDDMGWADVGCYGSKYYETPNIDRFASQAMRFTDGYAACAVCSPTRASIMTGKYPARLHITDWIAGEGDRPANRLKVPDWQKFLPLEETTIAKALKSVGYTTASIGKWHLGGPEYYPEHHGFDLNIAGTHFGHPVSYFWPYEGKSHTVAGLKAGGKEGEYLTDRLTDEAEKFLDQTKGRPFFLYFPHYAVHTPLMAKPALLAKYKAKTPRANRRTRPTPRWSKAWTTVSGEFCVSSTRSALRTTRWLCSCRTTAACGRWRPRTHHCAPAKVIPTKAASANRSSSNGPA